MTKAKVYFSDMRTRYGGLSLPQKLGKLIEAAGIGDIDFQNKFAVSSSWMRKGKTTVSCGDW